MFFLINLNFFYPFKITIKCPPYVFIYLKQMLQRISVEYNMSSVMRYPAFCICENKETDQHLCFHYIDRTIPLLHKSKISSLLAIFCGCTAGLCQTWSESPKTGIFHDAAHILQCELLSRSLILMIVCSRHSLN